MPTLELPDDHHDRIEALREELEATNAGPYASVGTDDVLAYLLDLADAVDDPERRADLETRRSAAGPAASSEGSDDAAPLPSDRDRVRAELESRNRRHGDADADEMDLYGIAATFDVTGRSDMTKSELVDAILDAAAEMAADPFSWAGVDIEPEEDAATQDGSQTGESDDAEENGEGTAENGAGTAENGADTVENDGPGDHRADAEGSDGNANGEDADDEDANGEDADDEDADGEDVGDGDVDGEDVDDGDAGGEPDVEAGDDDGSGSGQLNAMLRLLDTHADKWRKGDGDARYEVDLPDGSVETARTKDDVRAILFRKY